MAKQIANGFVKVAWLLEADVADPEFPTPTELNTDGMDLSSAIAWEDYALGSTGSDDIEDRALTDLGNAVSRGSGNYEAVLDFFRDNDVPFQEMANANNLVSGSGNNANRCLAKTGESYVVQLYNGGTHTLNLTAAAGEFEVRWFDPRNGGALQPGSVTSVMGGSTVSLGTAPNATSSDWIVLVDQAVLAPDDFGAWMESFTFPPGADLTPEGDPDGDGHSTWFEYLFGLDPSSGLSASPISAGLSPPSGTFSYTRRNSVLTNFTDYQVWFSEDLSGWTHDETALQIPDGEGGD
jgi:hypothetical protein